MFFNGTTGKYQINEKVMNKRLFFTVFILLVFSATLHADLVITQNPHAYAGLEETFHWQLQWTLDEALAKGTLFELRSKNMRTYYRWSKTNFAITNAEIVEVIPSCAGNLFSNTTYTNLKAALSDDMEPGDKVTIGFDSTASHFAGRYDEISIWIAQPTENPEEAAFEKVPNTTLILDVKAAPVCHLYLYCEPTPGHDGQIRTIISPEDRFGNASTFTRPVTIEFNWMGQKFNEDITTTKVISLDTPKQAIARLKATMSYKDLAAFEDIENGEKHYGQIIVTSNPVWLNAPVGKQAAFGEFHWHTGYSGDGAYSIEDGLTFARDQLNMDFCMSSDHTPHKDWADTVKVHEAFNDDDRFATLFGWEKSTRWGHENYYFTDPDHFVNPTNPDGPLMVNGWEDKLWVLQETLDPQFEKAKDFIAIPHHTNVTGAPHWFPYPFDKVKPSGYHRLFEIFQTRGNQERNHYDGSDWRTWRAWHFNNNASAQDALNKGFKMGFVGGTDNHASLPARIFCSEAAFGKMPMNSTGMTGLWTDRITRQDIFNGMFARNTWAVWDTRALAWFEVNGGAMGSELSVAKETPLQAHIKISAESPLALLEIVSREDVIEIPVSKSLDTDIRHPLGPAAASNYYYARAVLTNGGIIYISPVFINVH